ncbi:MAG: O-antigen ligase family protein [Oligoflexales bacterium]|nr:O-antigen ligase family protein [Oligoflexales bacterium]
MVNERSLLYLLILCLPLGAAVHSFATILCFILTIYLCIKNCRRGSLSSLFFKFKFPLIFSFTYLFSMIIASCVNPSNTLLSGIKEFLGYASWFALPYLFYLTSQQLEEKDTGNLYSLGSYICLIWGLIALSQYIWGWKLQGMSVMEDVQRPRGLYSHPLTLAYTALLIWPLSVMTIIKRPRDIRSLFLFAGVGLIIFFTNSRTVQIAALLVVLFNILYFLKGKSRLIILTLAAVSLTAVSLTDNPDSQKFRETFTEKGVDKFSKYPDDRLAFWHVHWLMIRERPVFGHGANLDTAYRTPYYEKIGLKDLEKKYEAHNLYIQAASNAGIIGLLGFLGWLLWFIAFSLSSLKSQFSRAVAIETLVAFALGGFTQNCFQDSGVRFGLTIFCIFILLLSKNPDSCHSSKQ